MLQTIRHVDEVATIPAICIPATCWTSVLICRFALWDLLFGRRRPWNFRSTARSLGRLALLMQAFEVAAYATAAALIVWLGQNGAGWDMMYDSFLQTLGPSAFLLLAPLLAWTTSAVVTVQLLSSPAPLPLPVRSRFCCCRLKRLAWARLFSLCALWHALACAASMIEAARQLVGQFLTMDAPGFDQAVERCRWDLEERCQSSTWRQVPDTRWDLHVQCALDCADVVVPIQDVILGAIFVACKLLAISAAWSLLARLWYLQLSWKLVVLATQLSRATRTTQEGTGSDPEKKDEEVRDASQAEEVLTPSSFHQGISEAIEVASARKLQKQGPPLSSPVARTALSEAGQASKLQVLQAVMSLDRPPSPSGSVASLDLKSEQQRPSAEALREMLENPITDGHSELVDFARTIARQCSKDSRAMSEASSAASLPAGRSAK